MQSLLGNPVFGSRSQGSHWPPDLHCLPSIFLLHLKRHDMSWQNEYSQTCYTVELKMPNIMPKKMPNIMKLAVNVYLHQFLRWDYSLPFSYWCYNNDSQPAFPTECLHNGHVSNRVLAHFEHYVLVHSVFTSTTTTKSVHWKYPEGILVKVQCEMMDTIHALNDCHLST